MIRDWLLVSDAEMSNRYVEGLEERVIELEKLLEAVCPCLSILSVSKTEYHLRLKHVTKILPVVLPPFHRLRRLQPLRRE